MIFEIPRSRRIFPAINLQFLSYPDLFHQPFPFFVCILDPQKYQHLILFQNKPFFFSKNQGPGPFPNERSWNFASIGAMDTSVRPNLTDLVTKTCKKPVKMKVSNSSRQFPRVYRGFPTLSNPPWGSSMMSEGSQPVAPTLHVKKKLITECREKSDHRVPRKKCMSRKKRIHVNKKEAHTCQEKSDHSVARKNWWLMSADYWLIIDHWWLMINNWWLMTDDWWLMIDDWYNMKCKI